LPVWFLLRIDSVRVDNLLPHPLTSLTLTHYILLYNPSCVVARNCFCHWNQKNQVDFAECTSTVGPECTCFRAISSSFA
jgi:hypothetical protein